MSSLNETLNNVPGAYSDFIIAMDNFASNSEYKEKKMMNFINSHPEAGTSEVIEYAVFELGLIPENDTKSIKSAMLQNA